MNVDVSKLTPGVFGVSHGSGLGGEIIRHATGSWAGHAFLYLGDGMMVQGAPPKADLVPATTYADAIWAWRMWDGLYWDAADIAAAQAKVTGRGHALVGASYDWPAYAGFSLEVMGLRDEVELSHFFAHDDYRVCSALVADALTFGGVPLTFTPEDGPGLTRDPAAKVAVPPNLIAPGMLLGLAQRMEWT